MPENDKAVLIYSTFPNPQVAEEVGGALVDARLAACVNIVPGMTSIYEWNGARHRDTEAVMIIKTRASLTEQAMVEVKRRHPYETPALIVLDVAGGSAPFQAWIAAQTGGVSGEA